MAYSAQLAALTVGSLMLTAPVLAVPTVTPTPTIGHPKIVSQVSGSGFSANEAVDVYFDTTDEFLAVTNASGAFSAHQLVVPKDASPGIHWVTAVGRKTGDAAQAPFKVTTPWLQFGFDQHGRRRNPYENVIDPSNVGTLDVLWSRSTGSIIQSAAAFDGTQGAGTIYIGSNDHKLYALDAASGSVQWTAATGSGILSTPAVANGKVYVGSNDTKMYAFNATTGAPAWSFATGGGGAVTCSPLVVGNIIYFGSGTGGMYALNATTGAIIWSNMAVGPIAYTAPTLSNGILYVGSTDAKLYALNASTGAVVWTFTTGGAVTSSPVLANAAVYFGSYDKNVYAVSAQSGALHWSYPTGDEVPGSAAVVNNTVFVGSFDGNFYALNAATGIPKWSEALGMSDLQTPSVANGVVYIGGVSNLFALDPQTGAVLWSAAISTDTHPIIADGKLYIGAFDNNMYAFALDGGGNPAYHRSRTPPSYASLHPDFRLKPTK